MAKNYTRPLAEVYQLLEVTRQATGDHLAACIVGPQYDVYRYGIEDDVKGETFKGNVEYDITLAYAKSPTRTYEVDADSVKLYADGLQGEVLNQAGQVYWTFAEGSLRRLIYVGLLSGGDFKRTPHVGDVMYVKGAASSSTITDWTKAYIVEVDIANHSVTLDRPITSYVVEGDAHRTAAAIYKEFSGYVENDGTAADMWSYNKTTESVHIRKGSSANKLVIDDGGIKLPLLYNVGTLYPEFRVLITSSADDEDGVIELSGTRAIQDALGTITVENELAYGCACALKGAADGGRSVFALRTNGTGEAAFVEAMKKTEFDSSLYSFVPLSTDQKVIDAVVSYNLHMSAPDVKMWRRTLCGVEAPGEYTVASNGNDGKAIKVTITPDTGDAPTTGTITVTSENMDLRSIALDDSYVSLHVGDKIVVAGVEYTLTHNPGTVSVEVSSSSTITEATDVAATLVKADTISNLEEYIIAKANKYATRRATVVFCDRGTIAEDGRVIDIPNRFLASEIAGIASAVVPQQSITHTEIQSIDRASKMYTKYTNDILDNIAAGGVLIVTQDTKGSACYIRHQLTTEMDKGNLYYEESCTRNLDNISYALADIVNKYIGKANVTTSALRAIKIDITAKLTEFTQDSVDDLVGPSLVDWDSLEVFQDKTFKDRVMINVNLYLPLPLNNIKLYAMAYVANVSI